EDRSAEDGPIDARYPLTPAPGAGYRQRTRLNVRDSDGTVIFTFGPLHGGSLATYEDCFELKNPHLLIDGSRSSAEEGAQSLHAFVRDHGIRILNVAGSRASEEPHIYDYVQQALRLYFEK
ncbi:MAG TPA: putative molybdenum carrier protein, partial [Tepidisphaeraceae bacterium]|nr:putative molybdenum carrier protein [Tepidisphaeraceae bacterium]